MTNKTVLRTEKLLRILADGKFHSGEKIAESLNISRTAVWKLIQKVSEWQVKIYSVRGKGYQIPDGLLLLDENFLTQKLVAANSRFKKLHVKTSIDSTANFVAELWKQKSRKQESLKQQSEQPIICVAEHQTEGRGRKGREWVSPFAANLYFSIGVELPLGLSALGGISLAVGMSLATTLNQLSNHPIKIKWPNDLLVNNKKLAGILVEASGDSNDSSFLNIGIGINWNMQTEQAEMIDQPWINLKKLVSESTCRNTILAQILIDLDKTLLEYEKTGLNFYADRWNELSAYYRQPVTIHRMNDKIEGIEVGIENNGALRLETKQGIQLFHSGEVSLRKRKF